MIVRERGDDWVMIAQHEHGRISGECAAAWRAELFEGNERRDEVTLAAFEHDRGWIALDEAPFWNDRGGAPYTFMDFPLRVKLVHYRKGIDEIRARNSYAGLLCSSHYVALLERERHPLIRAFIGEEHKRQAEWLKEPALYEKMKNLHAHLRILQFLDNLSLYLCLNEPGVSKPDELAWFRDGFPGTERFAFAASRMLQAAWADRGTVRLTPFPFAEALRVRLRCKTVAQAAARRDGLAAAYEAAPWEEQDIAIVDGG